MKSSKYDDRIYFCSKKMQFIHVCWDHAINKVSMWWYSNYHDKQGYIKGKLKTPKSWVLLGRLPEKTISQIKRNNGKKS